MNNNNLFIFLPLIIQKYYNNKKCSPSTLSLINNIQSTVIKDALNGNKELDLINKISQIITRDEFLINGDTTTLSLINDINIVLESCKSFDENSIIDSNTLSLINDINIVLKSCKSFDNNSIESNMIDYSNNENSIIEKSSIIDYSNNENSIIEKSSTFKKINNFTYSKISFCCFEWLTFNNY